MTVIVAKRYVQAKRSAADTFKSSIGLLVDILPVYQGNRKLQSIFVTVFNDLAIAAIVGILDGIGYGLDELVQFSRAYYLQHAVHHVGIDMGVGYLSIFQGNQQAGFLVIVAAFTFFTVGQVAAEVQQAIIFIFDLLNQFIIHVF